jgi:hypothetical protein
MTTGGTRPRRSTERELDPAKGIVIESDD